MKTLLSHGYFLNEDKIEQQIMMPYPPQGLLHIGIFIRSNGMDCHIYDSTFNSFSDFCSYLEKEKPTYLGLYVNLMTRRNIIRIMNFIRGTEILKEMKLILGGPDVKHHSELFIEHGADYCISGEGEKTYMKLIQFLEKNDLAGIQKLKGLTYKTEKKEIVFTGESQLIASLDDLPFPDFGMIDLEKYLSTWKSFHGFSSITISTMRGCPYNCRWCSKAVFGKTFRRRSASQVVKELARLQSLYSPDRFWIVDDVFTISKSWLIEFRDAAARTNLKISYECITRADRMDAEIIGSLKESGCFRLWIGAESGSQKVLDLMDRGVKAKVVQEMIKETKATGIESGTFLMLGYPGETEEDIMETIRYLKNADPDHYTITLSYPIPGTAFYEEVKDKGLKIPGEWGTYSDRELDFKRTYKRDYYHHAIRFINHSVKSHKYFREGRYLKGLKHSGISTVLRGLMLANRL